MLHSNMAPIVDPSWPRMGSGWENPFQNAPGLFIFALPDLRPAKSSGLPSTTIPSTPSLLQQPPVELEGNGQVTLLPCEESSFDHDGYPDTSEPKQGEADSEELVSNPRSDPLTPTPSPLSPMSTTSSGQESTTEKTKRSRRRRRRNRQVVEVGCVMGPRTVHLPHIPYHWTQNHTTGAIVPPSLWSPVMTAPAETRGSSRRQFLDIEHPRELLAFVR
ncbi:hypothetical protein EDB92DRAFT_378489 [Lactarius akahatsu]|uniref:Uncharacterized protein n=1 Tax=Lactarius akahatsu TaxID=416441 RepID=A0AAD4LHU9_9AGAM|nr:hypothetical protein EDB92DRAFT_378489 [Lactarius akahatsu]